MRKRLFIIVFVISAVLAATSPFSSFANSTSNEIIMENCGAYLFEWRPVDCGNGRAFAILVGGNTIAESNVILSRGYDYAYTFNSLTYARPWGAVPDLVNVDGIWAIPENEEVLPEGIQPVTRLILLTNNKNMASNERYVDIVHLPNGVDTSTLPPEVRKYLINVDGSDAGAYEGTITSGWVNEDKQWKYRAPDGSFITNSWIKVDDKSYYMDANGVMLADTITPDGIYVNPSGEKTNYFPGWIQDEKGWRYIMKNGYYAASTWIQDTDESWYYFYIAAYMDKDTITPDGFYVDENGVWDGNPSTSVDKANIGPGASFNAQAEGWEEYEGSWKYRLSDGNYVTNSWKQDTNGKWYYFDSASLMATNQTTPDGYYVGYDGVWNENEQGYFEIEYNSLR